MHVLQLFPYQYSAQIRLLDMSMSKQSVNKCQVDSDALQNLRDRKVFKISCTVEIALDDTHLFSSKQQQYCMEYMCSYIAY